MRGDRSHYKNNKVVENLVYCFYYWYMVHTRTRHVSHMFYNFEHVPYQRAATCTVDTEVHYRYLWFDFFQCRSINPGKLREPDIVF